MFEQLVNKFKELRNYLVTGISPKDPYMLQLFGMGTKTLSGQFVDEETAMKLAPFFSAVTLLASSMAAMPFTVLRRDIYEGDSKAKQHYLHDFFLYDKPNSLYTWHSLTEWIMFRTILHGNSYLLIEREGPFVTALWPLEPTLTKPVIKNGVRVYEYTVTVDQMQKVITYSNDEVLHYPAFAFDGLKAFGILDFARESIGLGLAVNEYGARFFAGDGMPNGFITHPAPLKKQAKINIKEGVREQTQGSETAINSGGRGFVVLDEGMSFTPLTANPEQTQFLGTRSFSTEEVCRWLHIPLFMMAQMSTAAGESAEEQYMFFLNYGLQPWMNRIVEENNLKLLDDADRKTFTFAHDPAKLIAVTQEKELDKWAKARNLGVASLNMISKSMRWPQLKGIEGNQRIAPSTMKVLGDIDPSTPVDINVIEKFIQIISTSRNMTKKQAKAIGSLVMPTADEKLVDQLIKPFLGSLADDPAEPGTGNQEPVTSSNAAKSSSPNGTGASGGGGTNGGGGGSSSV